MDAIHTKAATAGGVFSILVANISSGDVVKTIVLAVIGTVVSFTMSMLIKVVADWIKARKG